jgi:hypothetical protein
MSLIKKILSALVTVAGLYAAFMIYQQSPLAGVLFVILSLTIAIPLAVGTAQNAASAKTNIGKEPNSKLDVGVRQARATVLREDGEIRGAPSGR